MSKTRIAIVGYGNIGKCTPETVLVTPDIELSGVVRRNAGGPVLKELADIKMVQDVSELGPVGTALLCVPARNMQECAQTFLTIGIRTVDSFDIHTSIPELRTVLGQKARENGRATTPSAGWDPGSDSMVRALMQACASKGIIYTDFSPGVSMGYTVAAKAVKGVKGALFMTIPLGTGTYRRMVYVQLEDDADLAQVTTAIRSGDYFAHDKIHMTQMSNISAVIGKGHSVRMERRGVSGETGNQRFEFRMEISNPTLTSQIMVACARAAMCQQPGAYTMVEIPAIDLLPGSRESAITALV